MTPLTRKTGTARACGGMAVQTHTHEKPKKGSKTGMARACGGMAVPLRTSKIHQNTRNLHAARA